MGLTSCFVPEKDTCSWLFADYRKLNAVTIHNSYLLPIIIEFIDSRDYSKVFSTLNASSGYWQIEVDSSDLTKAEFLS